MKSARQPLATQIPPELYDQLRPRTQALRESCLDSRTSPMVLTGQNTRRGPLDAQRTVRACELPEP